VRVLHVLKFSNHDMIQYKCVHFSKLKQVNAALNEAACDRQGNFEE